jgi:hypothetical protein
MKEQRKVETDLRSVLKRGKESRKRIFAGWF